MREEPIEVEYFNWLCAKVLEPRVRNYYELMRILYQTEFTWMILGDRNRAADGLELREEFLRARFIRADPQFMDEGCSVLEVLIAFAKTASFQTDMPVRDWFWIFMNNLKLDEYRRVAPYQVPVIEDILNVFLWRLYEPNGDGGLFPLRQPEHDQRKVEIWYQFCEYVYEQGYL